MILCKTEVLEVQENPARLKGARSISPARSRSPSYFKNDRNGGIWQSGISKSLAEYVQRHVCFVNVQLSLH